MHVEIYVEELSAKAALDILVPRIVGGEHTYTVHNFRGKQELLQEVPKRLRAYARWIPADWRIAVLVDEDRQDCHELKAKLMKAAHDAELAERVLSRIVIEELEAWFFGDFEALRAVYPKLPATIPSRARFRDPDAIAGGTWEMLDQVLRKAGYRGGLVKTDTAKKVAAQMDPDRNRSRSFQVFRDGLRRLIDPETRAGVSPK